MANVESTHWLGQWFNLFRCSYNFRISICRRQRLSSSLLLHLCILCDMRGVNPFKITYTDWPTVTVRVSTGGERHVHKSFLACVAISNNKTYWNRKFSTHLSSNCLFLSPSPSRCSLSKRIEYDCTQSEFTHRLYTLCAIAWAWIILIIWIERGNYLSTFLLGGMDWMLLLVLVSILPTCYLQPIHTHTQHIHTLRLDSLVFVRVYQFHRIPG